MNSKEMIKRIIEFNSPSRIGFDFKSPSPRDIRTININYYLSEYNLGFKEWGYYPELKRKCPDFNGQMMVDIYGNIHGRLDEKSKGECIKGVLEDDWDLVKNYQFPIYDKQKEFEIIANVKQNEEYFLLATGGMFSILRDMRLMENFLTDVLLEQENIIFLIDKIRGFITTNIQRAAKYGIDGFVLYDDWGLQHSMLISPTLWRKLCKPIYAQLTEVAHQVNMKFFVHSCGKVYDIIPDFIEAGVDVLQFDQPALHGVENLARDFGGKVTIWSPIDIQTILPTGDKVLIEAEARKMLNCFKPFGGGFIAKDYPGLEAIGIKDEWAKYARDIFIKESNFKS